MLRRFAATRDPILREELVERFMPLARSLAWRYSGTREPLEDLIQVAAEGLVRAVDRYDPERTTAFSSYATPFILGTLRHYFRDATQRVHLPRGLQEAAQKLTKASDRIEATEGRAPGRDELSRLTGLDDYQVDEALVAIDTRRPASIEAGTRGEDDDGADTTLGATLGTAEPGYDRVESTLSAETVELDALEREALRLRFGHALTQREIGDRIGTSQMQVSRVLRRSLEKLLTAVRAGEPEVDREAA